MTDTRAQRLPVACAPLALESKEDGPRPSCAEYERRKGAWHTLNPNASPEEVEAARVRLARELGI